MFNYNIFNLFDKFNRISNTPIRPRPDDDYFQTTRMSFGDHIEELRWHLIRAIIGFVVALCLSFGLGGWIMGWIQAPIEERLEEFYFNSIVTKHAQHEAKMERLLAKLRDDSKFMEAYPGLFEPRIQDYQVKLNAEARKLLPNAPAKEEWIRLTFKAPPASEDLKKYASVFMTPNTSLVALKVEEPMMTWLEVCLVTALVIASPWIFYQLWSFIAAGLYPHEKRLVNLYLPISIFLFLGGVVFCYFLVIPRALGFLLEFYAWFGIEPQIRLSEWISFAIWVPVIFGLTFETPLIMFALERLGITTIQMYRSFRRIAWFALAIVAILINPTIQVDTMMMMWIPLVAFYELGIAACALFPRKPLLDLEVPEEQETIEV
jgi:sec-independent protein translocase protein TatC